jgi:serpin B
MSTIEDSTIKVNYTSGENYEAVELPYKGKQLSMVIVLPAHGAYEQVEKTFENNNFDRILQNLTPENATVTIPKFTIDGSVELRPVLDLLGMHAPFDESADFSGINGTTDLYISDVFHKAYISVDEKGTEATAASGMSFMEKNGPKDFRANRPFIFFIKDNRTKSVLFIGRVLNPVG